MALRQAKKTRRRSLDEITRRNVRESAVDKHIYIYIYIYIYAYPMKWGLKGVWHCCSLLWFPHTPPWNVILGGATSTHAPSRLPKNGSGNDIVCNPVFERLLNPISNDFWYQNRSPIHPKFISLSSLVSKSIFASKTKDRSIFDKTKILQNTRSVVQKSTLRISELMVKHHLHLVRICNQNPCNFDQNSIPNTCLKQTSSFDAVLLSKVSQNVIQNDPKMLDRNWGNRPWDHFSHIKPGSESQKHLHRPSRGAFWPHMEANWTPCSPSASCWDIIARAIFVSKAQCTVPMTGCTVHNLLIGAQPCTHPHRSSCSSQSYRTPLTLHCWCPCI